MSEEYPNDSVFQSSFLNSDAIDLVMKMHSDIGTGVKVPYANKSDIKNISTYCSNISQREAFNASAVNNTKVKNVTESTNNSVKLHINNVSQELNEARSRAIDINQVFEEKSIMNNSKFKRNQTSKSFDTLDDVSNHKTSRNSRKRDLKITELKRQEYLPLSITKNVLQCKEMQTSVRSDQISTDESTRTQNALSEEEADLTIPLTQEKLELSSWGLPPNILKQYKKRKISRMFQWQVECLCCPNVLSGGNLVYSAPTSAGKTLVSEILCIKTILEKKKKAIFILPFVSVVREKMFYFRDLLSSSGIRVDGYMGGHSPPGGFKSLDLAICTIEKANGIINRLLEENDLSTLGAVVVDELHLLGDSHRGYILELLLTKLKYIAAKDDSVSVQVVGMSATLPNLTLLSEWLDAALYKTSFRPVPLMEYIKVGSNIFDDKKNLIRSINPAITIKHDADDIIYVCVETVTDGHSLLIFCPTRTRCESLAQNIAKEFRSIGLNRNPNAPESLAYKLREQLDAKAISQILEQLKRSPAGLDNTLGKCVSFGVAFHHAGLTLDERDIIEGSFRAGALRVIVATSTLSSGVNLPARRVIVRSPIFNGNPIDILTYKQMIGRAGRMGADTCGESFLICNKAEQSIGESLMQSELKPVRSCLGLGTLSASFKRAILEVIASGVATTPSDVDLYANSTLLAVSHKRTQDDHQATKSSFKLNDPISKCVAFLQENEFIRLQVDNSGSTHYTATPLGHACLSASLPPDEGMLLFQELQRARQCFVLENELHIIYQVTPLNVAEQWREIDWLHFLNLWEKLPKDMKRVGDLVGVEDRFLVRAVRHTINLEKQQQKLMVHRRFYTALALLDLVSEVPIQSVALKFNCTRGMLQSLQQTASTYAGMVTSFCRRLGWSSVEILVEQFQDRLHFGTQRELLDLLQVPSLNGLRARALFNAGITTLTELSSADVLLIENALHSSVPFLSEKERDNESAFDMEQRKKQKGIWITGKHGVSEREAAEIIIEEARYIIQKELGLKEMNWKPLQSNDEDKISLRTNDKIESPIKETNSTSVNNLSEHKVVVVFPNSNESVPERDVDDERNNSSEIAVSDENSKSPIIEELKEMPVSNLETELKVSGQFKNEFQSSNMDTSLDCFASPVNEEKNSIGKSVEKCDMDAENETEMSSTLPVSSMGSETNVSDQCRNNFLNSNQNLSFDCFASPVLDVKNSKASFSAKENEIVVNCEADAQDTVFASPMSNSIVDIFDEPVLKPESCVAKDSKSARKLSNGFDDYFDFSSISNTALSKLFIPQSNIRNLEKRNESSVDLQKSKRDSLDGLMFLTLSETAFMSSPIANTSTNAMNEPIVNLGSDEEDFTLELSESESKDGVDFKNVLSSSVHDTKQNQSLERKSSHLEEFKNINDEKDGISDSRIMISNNTMSPILFGDSFELNSELNANLDSKGESENLIAESSGLVKQDISPIKNIVKKKKASWRSFETDESPLHEILQSRAQDLSAKCYDNSRHSFRHPGLCKSKVKTLQSSKKDNSFDVLTDSFLDDAFQTGCKFDKKERTNRALSFSSDEESDGTNDNKVMNLEELCPAQTNNEVKNDDSSSSNGKQALKRPRNSLTDSGNKSSDNLCDFKKKKKMKVSHTADIGPPQSRRVLRDRQNELKLLNSNLTSRVKVFVPKNEVKTLIPTTDEISHHWTGYSIIDVCGNPSLFSTFSKALKAATSFSLSLGCEQIVDESKSEINIGIQFSKKVHFKEKTLTKRKTSLSYLQWHLVGVAFCLGGTDAYFMNLDMEDSGDNFVPLLVRLDLLKSVLCQQTDQSTVHLFCFDIKEQYKVLYGCTGITISGISGYDPKVADWLLEPDRKERNLQAMVVEYLPMASKMSELAGVVRGGAGSPALDINSNIPAKQRCSVEAIISWHLVRAQQSTLNEMKLLQSFSEVEMPSVFCLARMELNGIGFSPAEASNLREKLLEEMQKIESKAHELAGRSFPLSSPKETSQVLYQELRLGATTSRLCAKRGSTGSRNNRVKSVSKAALNKLRLEHPLPEIILLWRKMNAILNKTLNPFIQPQIGNRVFGKCLTYTSTGRISMCEPNLQNIPRDFHISSAGSPPISMRLSFVPVEGNVLIAADYSHLELRILAHLSGDTTLCNILNSGCDVFKSIASFLKSVPLNEVTDTLRQSAKQICYGIIYGMGTSALAEQLEVDEMEAKMFSESFHTAFPGIRQFLNETVEKCRSSGYVETMLGRRRYISSINSSNSSARAQAERQAVNTTVQGTAADIAKSAMIAIDKIISATYPSKPPVLQLNREHCSKIGSFLRGTRPYLILQLHDELLYEIAEQEVQGFSKLMKSSMEGVIKLAVKLPVKIRAGPSWGQLSEIYVK